MRALPVRINAFAAVPLRGALLLALGALYDDGADPDFRPFNKEMLEDKGAVWGTVDYMIGVTTRPSKFVTKHSSSTTTDSKKLAGCRIPWLEFIADDSPYFIDDKLRLQVHVKITPQP